MSMHAIFLVRKNAKNGEAVTVFSDGSEITITIDQKVRLMVEVMFKVLALYLFLFAARLLIPTFNQFLIYFILVLLESIDFRFINLRKVLF